MTPPGVMIAVWIAGGSALGGLLRYWATGLAARVAGDGFPWGTLLVNATGSFLIGPWRRSPPTTGWPSAPRLGSS